MADGKPDYSKPVDNFKPMTVDLIESCMDTLCQIAKEKGFKLETEEGTTLPLPCRDKPIVPTH